MPRDWHAENRGRFDAPEVVGEYAGRSELQAPEEYLFARYVTGGQRILDVGVGAGRTTAALSEGAVRYLGVDYAPAMIDAAREKFPAAEFSVLDATDMSGLESAAFDVVVFSFNGIDCLHPRDRRVAAIRECRRVLAGKGLFIFSTHNPRSLVSRPGPRGGAPVRNYLRQVAGLELGTLRRNFLSVPNQAFVRGEGYVRYPGFGGMLLYAATPRNVVAEMTRWGFDSIEHVGAYHPNPLRWFLDPWYYYVFQRRD
jgi:SAM-dependent methyltransferase